MATTLLFMGLTHFKDGVNEPTKTSSTIGFEEITVPSIGWRDIVEEEWIGWYGSWHEGVGGDGVLVKAQTGAECADGGQARGDEGVANITEVIAHLIIGLLSLGVEIEGTSGLHSYEEDRVFVEFNCEQCHDIDGISRCVWDVILRGDLIGAQHAEEMIEEPSVGAIEGALVSGKLRLVCRNEGPHERLRPRLCHLGGCGSWALCELGVERLV